MEKQIKIDGFYRVIHNHILYLFKTKKCANLFIKELACLPDVTIPATTEEKVKMIFGGDLSDYHNRLQAKREHQVDSLYNQIV